MPSTPNLFQPMQVGPLKLQHRVVMAPLTRCRGSKDHVPIVPLMKKYYTQRSSTPGTLLITEGTFIAPRAGGYGNIPGIWNQDQIKAWRELWALGRAARPEILKEESIPLVAPSPIKLSRPDSLIPRELTKSEISEYIQLYATAAKNAVFEAGFDGVEIHGANGYLVDQFLQDVSNKRMDEYGGSIEGRSKFALQVVEAVAVAVGADRTAVRISPWGRFQDMKMEDPVPQYSHFVSALTSQNPDLAYLHVIEPLSNVESNDFIRSIWAPRPLISAENYERKSAIKTADEKGDLIAFGKYFIANPDLPFRLMKNIPLGEPDMTTYYVPGDKPGAEVGYIDYPFAEEHTEYQGRL